MDRGDAKERIPFPPIFDRRSAIARGAWTQSLGDLLQSFRPYLLSIARRGLPDGLRAKYDPADIVQETMLEAHRGLATFNGPDTAAVRVWLCGILRHNLVDLVRRYRDACKRSIGRERSLEAGLESGGRADVEVDPYPTPCTQAIVRESVAALPEALRLLPIDEQAVVILRHFECRSYEGIGPRLGRSLEAARKFWGRAILRLQRFLKETRKSTR